MKKRRARWEDLSPVEQLILSLASTDFFTLVELLAEVETFEPKEEPVQIGASVILELMDLRLLALYELPKESAEERRIADAAEAEKLLRDPANWADSALQTLAVHSTDRGDQIYFSHPRPAPTE